MARLGLEQTAKFKLLVRRLGLPKPYVRGLLETLWDVANATGNPNVGDAESVEASSEWPGDPGRWFAVLRDGGWIDQVGASWYIHDYWEHAQDFVIRRETQKTGEPRAVFLARKKAEAGGKKPDEAEASGNIPDKSGKNTSCQDKTRPEERQKYVCPEPPKPATHGPTLEIKSEEHPETTGLEPTNPPEGQQSSKTGPRIDDLVPEAIILEFPTTGKDGQIWRLSQTQVDVWASLYQTIDVVAECRRALAWVLANPTRRKTPRGMPNFLVGWFNRSVNRPAANPQPQPSGYRTKRDTEADYIAQQFATAYPDLTTGDQSEQHRQTIK